MLKACKVLNYHSRFRFVNLYGSSHLKPIKKNGDILPSILQYLSDYDRYCILEGHLSVNISFSKDWHGFKVSVVADDRTYTIEELNELAQNIATALLKYEEDLYKQHKN